MNALYARRGLCALPVSTDFAVTWCLRPQGHPGDHLDHAPRCVCCEKRIDPSTPYGPMQPVHLDGGSAWLFRAHRDLLAAERAGETAA